jgi:hypothetical protein
MAALAHDAVALAGMKLSGSSDKHSAFSVFQNSFEDLASEFSAISFLVCA